MKQHVIELLTKLGSDVDSDGDIMSAAERHLNDEDLQIFASHLIAAEEHIKRASEIFDLTAAPFTEDDVFGFATIAQALDESDDPILQKEASVLDELLHTIGANPKEQTAFKQAQSTEVDRLRAKYHDERGKQAYDDPRKQQQEQNNAKDAIRAIDKKVKAFRPLEAPLSTRYSPDMPGVSLMRIGDNVYQCPITKKIYDYRSGYVTAKGNKIPGSDVSNQTQHLGFRAPEHMNFSTREEALNKV